MKVKMGERVSDNDVIECVKTGGTYHLFGRNIRNQKHTGKNILNVDIYEGAEL